MNKKSRRRYQATSALIQSQDAKQSRKSRVYIVLCFGVIAALIVMIALLVGYISILTNQLSRHNTSVAVIKLNGTSGQASSATSALELQNSTLPLKHYNGVAVTLMLGSPKWFQQRYSIMINQIYAFIPSDWIIQIFYIRNNKMSEEAIRYPGLQRRVQAGQVMLTPLPLSMGGHMKRKDLMRDPWLWESMAADRVLMFGGNSALCANSPVGLKDFAHYDYVGAPWSILRGRGGSGELSLRSRGAVLEFLKSRREKKEPEDVALVKALKNVAPREVTHQFAASSAGGSLYPMGISGTLGGLNDSMRAHYIDYCPEIKMLFPVLHSGSCFGASPNPRLCFEYLCEHGGLHCQSGDAEKWISTNK
mmetsp:Transcript_1229/g.2012  ORF Transcript_1229/g.2012 Transcript_1229/m.2012 type:complete len:363 (-) Transcript_1229:112-1200(-)